LIYPAPNKQIYFSDLGLIPYREAWDLQESFLKALVEEKLVQRTRSDNSSPESGVRSSENGVQSTDDEIRDTKYEVRSPNYLFFCEHPNVYTIGKSGKAENALFSEEFIKAIGAEYVATNRGGDITYHGPGQLVAYPVLDLENFFTDIHRYMRSLEESVILTCASYGLDAGRVNGMTGVWIDPESKNPRKICAMGVKTSRWVTMHGLALNVNTDLSYFGHIVPCGLLGKPVTSLENEMGRKVALGEAKEVLREKFCGVFEAELLQMPKIVPQTL